MDRPGGACLLRQHSEDQLRKSWPTWAIQRGADVIMRTKSSSPSVHTTIWTSCHPSSPSSENSRDGKITEARQLPAHQENSSFRLRERPCLKKDGSGEEEGRILCASTRVHRFTPIRALSRTLTQAHMHTPSNKSIEN